MLQIKEWKYRDMMRKVTQYGDIWMYFNEVRDEENFNQVVVNEQGYVTLIGGFKVEKETEKAVYIDFAGVWHEWLPKSTVIIAA